MDPRPGAGEAAIEVGRGLARIAEALETSLDRLVAGAVAAIWEQVPAYRDSRDDRLRTDVAAHVEAVGRAFLISLTDRRPARQTDFGPTPAQARRRVEQGIALADFLQAFRIGQFTLWQGVLEAVGDDPEARDAALSAVAQLMHLIEVASTLAAQAYLDAQQYSLAESDRVRRDLLEDLLARRDPSAGPRLATLRGVGLLPDTTLLVVSAAAVTPLEHEHGLRDAAATLRPSRNRGAPGLAVVRQDEIVAVVPVPRSGADTIVTHLGRARADLERRHVRLAVGVSTVHTGLREVPEAYAEAYGARNGLGGAPGMVTLPLLSSFDYLTLREDETARRIIRPEVRRFVEEDLATGGGLVDTLVEYAACDLNARTAARHLHLHVNTAYYRLDRIAEKTGCDVRRFSEVVELLIAIRLLRAPSSRTS